ncbi:DNA-binding protein RFX6-like [Glandiceps talaboti]
MNAISRSVTFAGYQVHSSSDNSPDPDTLTWTDTGNQSECLQDIYIDDGETFPEEDEDDDVDGDKIEEMKEQVDKENEDKNISSTKLSQEEQTKKQSQIAATLKWLSENYERAEGVCLPRCVLYTHYLDFCKKNKFTPSGAATFGKVIRQKFPKLTTRRLGTRGQSKYHYYGIGIKESSIYYHSVYSGRGLTRFSGTKVKTEGTSRKYSLSSKTGTLLPDFPDAHNLILPDSAPCDKVETFIMMYRTHCQRILDTVISANFDEVQNFLLHFWQGMPEHLTQLLKCDIIVDIVGLCDTILYKVLIDVLIPSTIQDLPDSLSAEIRMFAKRLPGWLTSSLDDVPEHLKSQKLEVMKTFIQSLKRQTSFVHLAQTARSVLLSHENVNQMAKDLNEVDFSSIWNQGVSCSPEILDKDPETTRELIHEFEGLLNKQAPIEAYTEWIDSVIDRCALQTSKENGRSFKERARDFLLNWSFFTSRFMRDLTLHSAASFGSFHLIYMMFDEYVFLVIETQQNQIDETSLQQNVRKHMKTAGEISTKAKIRSAPSKGETGNSRAKKRRFGEVESPHLAAEDRLICPSPAKTAKPAGFPDISSGSTTAFSRPTPHHNTDIHTELEYPEFTSPAAAGYHVSAAPNQGFLSQLKYQQMTGLNGCSSFDRATTSAYLSQLNPSTYTDHYTSPYNTASAMSIDTQLPTTHYNALNIPPSPSFHSQSTFWADSRFSPSYNDSYSGYGKSMTMGGSYGMNASYGKRGSMFPTSSLSATGHNTLEESMTRSAFQAAARANHYYSRQHDNIAGTAGLQLPGNNMHVGTYGSSFIDVTGQNQFGRQDTWHPQDDIFSGSMRSTALPPVNKAFLTTYR